MDNFDFDYNVLEKTNSILGYKHTEETLSKMKGRTNALGYKHNLETIAKLKELSTNKTHSIEAKDKMKEIWAKRRASSNSDSTDFKMLERAILPTNSTDESVKDSTNSQHLSTLESNECLKSNRKKIKGKIVVVINIQTNITQEYNSISEAAIALKTTRNTLRTYINNQALFNFIRQDASGLVTDKLLITIKQ